MGAWDTDSFGNDDAADWVWELEKTSDLSAVEKALQTVLTQLADDDYVEAPSGSEAIAACEVIARLKGNFGKRSAYSEGVDNWVAAHKIQPSTELTATANRALDIVMSEASELFQLWQESEELAAWRANVSDLRQRMNT